MVHVCSGFQAALLPRTTAASSGAGAPVPVALLHNNASSEAIRLLPRRYDYWHGMIMITTHTCSQAGVPNAKLHMLECMLDLRVKHVRINRRRRG